MTEAGFRRLVLGLDGAIEAAHMGHPDFRVGGRIFATLRGDGVHGMVSVTPDEQRALVRDRPDVFAPESGAWGLGGSTRVRLDAADAEVVGEALTMAWKLAVAKGPTKKKSRKARR
jgi:hypothetical protein